MSIMKEAEKRTVVFMVISFIAVIISFICRGQIVIDPAWIAVLLCGIPIIKGAVEGLVTEFDIKADVLVSLALIAAVVIGEIFAAGEIALIMTIGAYLEERTVDKARAGIEKLVNLTPQQARRITAAGEELIPAQEVQQGDRLRVLAGETIAVDGFITNGQTTINQAVMTGESLPVDKAAGDKVFSGTVNQLGTFEMQAEKVGEDSSIQRMVRLVESADAGKAKIVGLADKWATWIVVIALMAAGITWFVSGEVIRAVTILVVFCPCALVLATPTAIMAGIGNAAKYGILIREGDALERLDRVRRIAFDKTGTLTFGNPEVVKIAGVSEEYEKELFPLIVRAELRSPHPLGKAIISYYRKNDSKIIQEPEQFEMLAGRGVFAVTAGKVIYAGNEHLMEEQNILIPEQLFIHSREAKEKGCTVIYTAVNGKTEGIICLSDQLRPDAAATIKAIHNAGVKSILLTGDIPQSAAHIASQAGITEVQAECLPQDKMEIIAQYQEKQEYVCMVGDGINDAPALKRAEVGIAMGGIGSDIAIDAADIVLIGDDMSDIPHLLNLSSKTMKTIRINLAASMLLNFGAIALAITGILTPVLGALVHNAGSVAVIINSSLLLKWRDKKKR